MRTEKVTEVLLGHFLDGDIRVVFYYDFEEGYGRQRSHGHGRGVADFVNKTLLDVLMWIESTLGFEKEKVSTVF